MNGGLATPESPHLGGGGPRLSTRLLVLLVVVVAIATVLAYTTAEGQGQGSVPAQLPSRLTVDGKTFAITYLATTPSEWQKGLMNTTVSEDTLMLFVFPRADYYSFWMYDVNSSLDIIWLSGNSTTGKVVYMELSAPPCHYAPECATYVPTASANYVLEAQAGFATRNSIAIGSFIQLG